MDHSKKSLQLGMASGTAANQLRKKLLFAFAVELKKDICFRCKMPIENERDLSIEHKEPWLDSAFPKELFFNLDNVDFSHLHCNSAAARRPNQLSLTPEAKATRSRQRDTLLKHKKYDAEVRHQKYVRTGH